MHGDVSGPLRVVLRTMRVALIGWTLLMLQMYEPLDMFVPFVGAYAGRCGRRRRRSMSVVSLQTGRWIWTCVYDIQNKLIYCVDANAGVKRKTKRLSNKFNIICRSKQSSTADLFINVTPTKHIVVPLYTIVICR